MHSKKIKRWFKPTLLASIFSIILGVILVPQVQAQATTPTPSCNASRTSCTVTFTYAGDYYMWPVPADVRSMSLSISGAQGGRSGGNGTKTLGTFKTIPTGNLYVYVGGQGSSGNGAAGGYNGGGQAGSGHGDEGSGGGATDIRTSTLLADRIAVAAGGGGTGGWIGGSGAMGSGTTGIAGGNGQGLGGGAGTSSVGGSGGSSYGAATTPGTAGSLGQGGSGGSANTPGSTVAGGGGGGGGFYGGGGGGADTDPVGVDGGGGGSGSSYANSTKLQSVAYYSGAQAGDGIASITYNFSPSVTSFTTPISPSNAVSPVFNITFGQSITGITADDFTISGSATGCYVSTLVGSGASYAATVAGCSDGTIALTLKADSVSGNVLGPVRPVSTTTITLDRTLPEINTLTKQPSTNDLVIYKAVFTESVTGLAADSADWLVKGNGCVIQSMTGSGSDYVITISNCLDGNLAGLVLNSLSVVDAAGNIGPSLANQTAATKIDTKAPVFSVTDVTAPGVGGLPTWVFDSEEPTTGMTQTKFVFSGTATSCSMNYTVLRSGLGWQVALTGCGVGTTQVTLAANAVADLTGNLGPTTALASNVITITADEVVNQKINPPTGSQGSIVKVPTKPDPAKDVLPKQHETKPQLPTGKATDNLQQKPEADQSVTKELESQGKEKLVISPNQQQPLFIAITLAALAVALGSFAVGSQLRIRRRRH